MTQKSHSWVYIQKKKKKNPQNQKIWKDIALFKIAEGMWTT